MALISNSPTAKAPMQSSRPQDTAVGTFGKVTASKIKIETSAPMEPHELGRAPKGWLK